MVTLCPSATDKKKDTKELRNRMFTISSRMSPDTYRSIPWKMLGSLSTLLFVPGESFSDLLLTSVSISKAFELGAEVTRRNVSNIDWPVDEAVS